MKRVVIEAYGAPEKVARCVDGPDVGAPGAGEVVFDVLLFPINPADVSFCRGTYRLKPTLPATPGAECIGRVTALGAGVTHVKPGDLVINLQRENWAQRRRVNADDVIPVPAKMDLQQAAMLRINPPTAQLLLSDLVDLNPGDWVIQNVANSAVGRIVITLARRRGIKTVNVVRRESLFPELKALGADVCVVDGADLAERVKAQTGAGAVRLALEAVGGQAAARLAACLSDGGTICTYGAMRGEDPVVPRGVLVNAGVKLTGFILGRFLATRSPAQIRDVYADLGRQILDGVLHAPVEKVYPIDDIKEALAHAQRGERTGKILVEP
jgi:NADPH:quinone reductase-like Zn-dependent oxidoreductase